MLLFHLQVCLHGVHVVAFLLLLLLPHERRHAALVMQQAHTSDMMHHNVYTNFVYNAFCTATQLSQATTGATAAAKVTILQKAGSTAYTKQEAYQHTYSIHHHSPEPRYAAAWYSDVCVQEGGVGQG